MANTKKVNTTGEVVEDISQEKKSAVVTNKKDDNSAEIDQLKQQLSEQSKQIEALMALLKGGFSPAPAAKDEGVTIIHLAERDAGLTTYITLSNLVITMSNFGEERHLTLQQFEELVGKYRSWFNKGIISVAAGYEDVAVRYGLKTAKDYPVKSDFFRNLEKMDMATLEEVYPKLPQAGKSTLISMWSRKAINGDPYFRDLRKLETLNRVSGGAVDQLIADIRESNKKK